jgi:hypothetical protein
VHLHGLEVDAADTDGGGRRDAQHLAVAVRVQEHRGRVARVRDEQPVRDRVVDRVEAGRDVVAAEALGLLVEVVQDLVRRQVEPGEGLHDGAQLPMIAAEVMECPMTSPTISATRLPGSGIASYQSPPTWAVFEAGR